MEGKMTQEKKKTRKVASPEAKLLKEAKLTNKLLLEIRDILDKQWRQIAPNGGK